MDEKEYTKSFDLGIWKRLLPIIGRFKKYMIGMVALNFLSAGVDVCFPLFQKYAIANFIGENTLSGLVPFTLSYIAAILLQSLVVAMVCRMSMYVEMYLGRDLRRDLFRHLQELSLSYYNVTPVGYPLTRLTGDTFRIGGMVAWGFQNISECLFYILGSFAAMLFLNWRLALVIIVIVPVMAALTAFFQPRILDWNRKVRKQNSKITGAFNEGITGKSEAKRS